MVKRSKTSKHLGGHADARTIRLYERRHLHVWTYVKNVLDALLSGSADYALLRPDIWAQQPPKTSAPTESKNAETKPTTPKEKTATRRAKRS